MKVGSGTTCTLPLSNLSRLGREPLQSLELQTSPSKMPFDPLANPFSVAKFADKTQGAPLTKNL